jgi:ATP-dependent helicase/nuclease subunit A
VNASRKKAPDQDQRDAAVRERQRNVLIDAGAGTGKTTILVERLVNMIAPRDGAPAIPIARIAAVTFTRRAAGELRFRIREHLLAELAAEGADERRRPLLHDALAGIDTAHVGTIHSFSDRLLRLRPREARLSPTFEILEDNEELVQETFTLLLEGAQSGTLAASFAGTPHEALASEAEQTVQDALRAGLRATQRETEWWIYGGLDTLVRGLVNQRDLQAELSEVPAVDLEIFREYAREFIERAKNVRGSAPGQQWLMRNSAVLRRLLDETDSVLIFAETVRDLGRKPSDASKKVGFANDDKAWAAWYAFVGDTRQKAVRATPLRDDLLGPFHRWMACRLVRLRPIVLELYDRVKARHRAVDQIELLLGLRELLHRDKGARAEYQALFDHILVDEFQDTDPLQAEILLYLCENGARADRWDEVDLSPGKLTLVGDPKQSIYRFRRADIAMYDRVRSVVARGPHLPVRLSANFRSQPALIDWFNDRFKNVLGRCADPEHPFDPKTGEVFHQELLPGHGSGSEQGAPVVHVVPFERAEGDGKADEYRELEAVVMARYLRWLVERSGVKITDPVSEARRAVGFGDVAILAIATTNLRLLFSAFDAMGVPYSARGGTLFLDDPLHRWFLLGLRAIADREDGVAEASLLRRPFFSVDLLDVLRARTAEKDMDDERALRGRAAIEWVRELRRRRFERSPGETARDLLEGSAFARVVALGPNGAQRLRGLREICLALEQLAASEGLDYDAATARLRGWVDDPPQLDPPFPVDRAAVQVMTVHQAKGLEFPVVLLWDGRASWAGPRDNAQWRVDRDGRGWALRLDNLDWEEPQGLNLAETEQRYRDAERRRIVYVAATRARDLLVIPKAGMPGKNLIPGALVAKPYPDGVMEPFTFVEGSGAEWAKGIEPVPEREIVVATDMDQQIEKRWLAAADRAAEPRFRPVAVSSERVVSEDEGELERQAPKRREGRYGALFGETVHRAIGLAMRDQERSVEEIVRVVASRTGLTDHLDAAACDVANALGALRAEGLLRPPGPTLRLEYPVVGAKEGGKMLVGYVDLVSAVDGKVDIIDFKTDQPPAGDPREVYPEYVEQVRVYGRLLEAAGLGDTRSRHHGLLFTAEKRICWV